MVENDEQILYAIKKRKNYIIQDFDSGVWMFVQEIIWKKI